MPSNSIVFVAVSALLLGAALYFWFRHVRNIAQMTARMQLGGMINDFYCSSRKLSMRDGCWIMSYSHMLGVFDPSIEIRVSLTGNLVSTKPDDLNAIVKKYESAGQR